MRGQTCKYSPELGQWTESYFHYITSGIGRSSFKSAQRRTALPQGPRAHCLLQCSVANKAQESIFNMHMFLLQLPCGTVDFAASQLSLKLPKVKRARESWLSESQARAFDKGPARMEQLPTFDETLQVTFEMEVAELLCKTVKSVGCLSIPKIMISVNMRLLGSVQLLFTVFACRRFWKEREKHKNICLETRYITIYHSTSFFLTSKVCPFSLKF